MYVSIALFIAFNTNNGRQANMPNAMKLNHASTNGKPLKTQIWNIML